MALFQSQSKKDETDASPSAPDAALSPSTPDTGVKPSRTNPKPSTQGGTQVANIGKSISIKGDLTGNEDMVIEGKVEGKVDLPNNQLTIGANGSVQAEVTAKGIIVVGRVSGNIQGIERVEIQGTGIVDGDVAAPRLIVAEGAVVNGAIKMTKQGAASNSPATNENAAPTEKPPEVRRAG